MSNFTARDRKRDAVDCGCGRKAEPADSRGDFTFSVVARLPPVACCDGISRKEQISRETQGLPRALIEPQETPADRLRAMLQ
jgi:hypothetical protein